MPCLPERPQGMLLEHLRGPSAFTRSSPVTTPYHTPPAVVRRNAVLLIGSVLITVLAVRVALAVSPDSDLNVGPHNVHHLFTGVLLIAIGGIPLAIFRGHTRRLDLALVVFGVWPRPGARRVGLSHRHRREQRSLSPPRLPLGRRPGRGAGPGIRGRDRAATRAARSLTRQRGRAAERHDEGVNWSAWVGLLS